MGAGGELAAVSTCPKGRRLGRLGLNFGPAKLV